jgi:DNA polymerase II large subunit
MRPEDERYFERLETELDEALAVAQTARERGGDPTTDVEIPVAKDMADRVENILGIDGVAERVRELEGEMSREEAALELVSDFVDGEVGDYETRAGKIEGAVRTAVALLTEGVVAAPIEGIDRVELLENDDGTEFINVYYAGPIRSAGGTAQALSVLVADYARALLGIEEYEARDDEVGRYAEEVALYDKETGLQYAPTEKEAQFIAKHMPIMLDGEATGDAEVSGFRDLDRVATNASRGGMCLVLGEGIALKAPKIQRYTRELDEVSWPWLQDLIDGNYGGDEGDTEEDGDAGEAAEADTGDEGSTGSEDGESDAETEDDSPPRAEPSKKFLQDLIAGRPVFSHPSESGGFRLRYGRSRNHGHATAGIHPATMHLVDDFLAPGTQIKTERPGKAAGIIPVDTIEGPTVRLANGEVRQIDDAAEAREVRNGVERILDIGEYLVNYGEFVENNHSLAPASYAFEWWIQEFAETDAPVQAMRDRTDVALDDPTPAEAIEWAGEYDAPLHPAYTYLYHDVSVDDVLALARAIDDAAVVATDGATQTGSPAGRGDTDRLALDRTEQVRRTLETLLVEHTQHEDRLTVPVWRPLARTLGFDDALSRSWAADDLSEDARTYDDGENAILAVNEISPFPVRERAPTRIGNRMGRPEKSEKRELSPAVHTLFPISEAGGSQRSVEDAVQHGDEIEGTKGDVTVEVGRRECRDCGTQTHWPRCPDCGGVAEAVYVCPDCGKEVEPDESGRAECDRCETLASPTQEKTIDVSTVLQEALDAVGERTIAFDNLKAVKGLSSEEKAPEPLEKGVLRAKHDVSAFKDGTIRYDMTDLPVTAVKPAELDVTVDQFRELGYDTDIRGDPLRHEDQVVELNVQDVILSEGGADFLLRIADFVDDLLTQYYGMEPYYELEDRDDLVGELVFGMAPHTSAATVGRVVGYTNAAVGYAHPYFHAAKRRNCFHPETKLWYDDDDGWQYEQIESFVEDRLDDPDEDDFGTLVENVDGQIRVPSLNERGEIVTKSVGAISKHPVPDHMVKVRTRSGRELTVTPDHEMQTVEDGSLTSKFAAELDTTDNLVKPEELDIVENTEAPQLDLLAELLDCETIDNEGLMIKGLEKDRLYELFEDCLADDWDGQFYPLKHTAEQFDMSHKTLSNYLYRSSFPASLLTRLLGDTDAVVDFVPSDVTLGMKRDRVDINRFVTINERVATLLGYYAAEGFARAQQTLKGTIHQTTICGTEEEARDFFVDVFESEFGVDPYRENHAKVTVSGRLLRTVFDTILDAGVYADTKRIPQCIFDAPDRLVSSYFRGYFSGDGSADANSLAVEATTVSETLKEDILALLTRLGITAHVNTVDPVPLSDQFPEFYDDDDQSMTATSYIIKILSKEAVTFSDRIGFHLSRKDETLTDQVAEVTPTQRRVFDGGNGEYLVEPVESVEYVQSDCEATYCLTVQDTHSLVVSDTVQKQCDGDEDCVMLLMDGLLNFSRKYLPDQRGGSVAADSRLVAIDPEGDVRFMTFGEFWNELESPVESDGKFRKRTCAAEGWRTYAFDDNHEVAPQPIEKAIRYRADEDERLLRVETQFGRSIEITEEHSLFRYDDGIEEVAGRDLAEGDLLLAPQNLPVETERTTIDVTECFDDPYVLIDDHVEDLLRTAWETTDYGSPTHQAFNSGLAYRLERNKIAYSQLEAILDRAGFAVPADIRIGLKGSEDGIRRKIELDEDFAWLLGLFVAEGTLSSVCPALHNSEEQIVSEAVERGERVLGIEPRTRWSNKSYEVRFPAVFREVLYTLGFENCDEYNSSEKVIPGCIRTAPRELVLSFLRGFIAGDGSNSSDGNVTTIGFYTTSEDVKDGLLYLLHRLGLVGNVSTRERDETRQPIYTVSVPGGATDNPLRQILNGDEPYQPKSLVVTIPTALLEIREMNIPGIKQLIPKYLKRRENISIEKLGEIVTELDDRELPAQARERLSEIRPLAGGDLSYLRVKEIEQIGYDGYLYDLQVGGNPIFTANWLYAHNSMDAPLVMSSRIDPSEIDDEAHNIDIMEEYPVEFYEATREMADPEAVEDAMTIAEETLGTDREYTGFRHTHETTDIAAGPDLSAYKTLGSMEEKMDAQLALSRKLRAVDETDVAERIIEFHFLPDLLGNLKAFASQEVRCLDCGKKYRRAPLSGDCRKCGGNMTLTVHEGSVTKYMQTAIQVAAEFGTREYTTQRLEILKWRIERIFEDDTNKPMTLGDYM